jgi:hypothetical protein
VEVEAANPQVTATMRQAVAARARLDLDCRVRLGSDLNLDMRVKR